MLGSEVKEVYAEISNRMNHQDFDDTGFLTMEFDNGVFARLDTSWSRPKILPDVGDVTMSVTGEKGVLTLDMFAQNVVHYSTGQASGQCGMEQLGQQYRFAHDECVRAQHCVR